MMVRKLHDGDEERAKVGYVDPTRAGNGLTYPDAT